jgi:lipopolysaccharide/colanic/teichoic acid biosynthesis glycosyltransferase
MALAPWLSKLPRKIWFQKRLSNGFFLDEQAFQLEMARERMRVDRNGSPLAILTIDLPAARSKPRDFDYLGRVLAGRLRITDSIGFLSAKQVGVLLPDTSKSGAWKVATDVCAVYPPGHDRPNCDVFTYPNDDDRWVNGDSKHQQELPTHESGEAVLDRFIAFRTPASKRIIDVFGASLGLLLSAPMLLAIAAAIKATSRGPAFYSQEREGLGGRRFRIYKFRTMRLDADRMLAQLRQYSEQDGPAFKLSRDPRTTWIGRWLRKTSMDELPQLWNVLRGDMSLVGPRPLPIDESLQCSPWQRQRLAVLPGLTCTWQIVGRNTVPFDEWMRMDLQYVRRQSFLYDIELLLRTPTSLVLQRGPR